MFVNVGHVVAVAVYAVQLLVPLGQAFHSPVVALRSRILYSTGVLNVVVPLTVTLITYCLFTVQLLPGTVSSIR